MAPKFRKERLLIRLGRLNSERPQTSRSHISPISGDVGIVGLNERDYGLSKKVANTPAWSDPQTPSSEGESPVREMDLALRLSPRVRIRSIRWRRVAGPGGSSANSGHVRPGLIGCNLLHMSWNPAASRIVTAGPLAQDCWFASEFRSPARISGSCEFSGPDR